MMKTNINVGYIIFLAHAVYSINLNDFVLFLKAIVV